MLKIYDWNQLGPERKAKLNELKPIFICGPREMSAARILQLSQQLAAKGNLVWGCLKDEYIQGLEGSPQFKALTLSNLQQVLTNHKLGQGQGKVTILEYYQRDWQFVVSELKFKALIFINGSWQRMLHLRPEYWFVERQRIPYKRLSPFVSEAEAKAYERALAKKLAKIGAYELERVYSDQELLALAETVAKRSYDYLAQVGAVVARAGKVLLTAHNTIVPYETYALQHGSIRELNFSPMNDQNHYDTCHAEINAIIAAQKQAISLKATALYIPLLPCPACARALVRSDIATIVYKHDHSQGYGARLLTAAGKKLVRIA